jgi:hypothetical protein
VSEPASGYTVFQNFAYPQFKYVANLLVSRPRELIVVAMPVPMEANPGFRFAGPQPSDEVLFERAAPVRRSIYRRRFTDTTDGRDPYARFLAEQLVADEYGLEIARAYAKAGFPAVLEQFTDLNRSTLPR